MNSQYEPPAEGEPRRSSQEHNEPDETSSSVDVPDVEQRSESFSIPASLPEILPSPTLDFDLAHFTGEANPNLEKVNKRASNVQKLAQENEKLKAELKAMTDRLEAAERRREKLQKRDQKEQSIMEPSAT